MNKSSERPDFKATPLETLAITVIEGLKTSDAPTKPSQEAVGARALRLALRAGNKTKAMQYGADLYGEVLQDPTIAAAYGRIQGLKLNPNPDFQIVMDSLKGSHGGQAVPVYTDTPLDDALVILLLAITRSDKNSISYLRIDEKTGKPRPTTFPLTETLIRNFLAPFAEEVNIEEVVRRSLYFRKGVVIGNPAAEIAHRYHLRRQAYEAQMAAYEQQAAAQEKSAPQPSAPRAQPLELLSAEFEKALELAKEPLAQQAVIDSFQVRQLRQLLQIHHETPGDFGRKLTQIYNQRLSPAQASTLSARLASRMKRTLMHLESWKDEYWDAYQSLMQSQGVWDGEAWLEKWRANKSGKQILAKTGKDYLLQEKTTTVEDLLDQTEKMQDKLKGKHMLSEGELLAWMNREPSKAPPEQQKVLQAFSRSERIDDLIELALETSQWQTYPSQLRERIYRVLLRFCETDMDRIKQEVLKDLDLHQSEQAKELITLLELQINKMAALFKKDFRLNYSQAIDTLKAQKAEATERVRLNSREYLNSPAAHYAKYRQS